jgi:hypothetical protein
MAYCIPEKDFKENEAALRRGEPVEIPVRKEDLEWRRVKAIVSSSPAPGAKPADILTERGVVYDRGKWFVKVLEELPEEDIVFRTGG